MESTDGDAMFRHACAMGLEGIVAKRRDKPYSVWPVAGLDQGQEPGRTSRDTVDRMIEGLTLAVLA
jgi:hypothetical protein